MKSRDNLARSELDIQFKHNEITFVSYIAAGRRFFQSMPVSFIYTNNRHNITSILIDSGVFSILTLLA